MSAMDELDYADMIEHTPVTSVVTEYREPGPNGQPGRLVGACLTDRQGDGLSMIYSFYDPDHTARASLGSFIILDHIRRAAAEALPYVYLGYWVEGSPRMQYKVRYRPLERLTRDGWQLMDEDEQHRLIAAATAPRRAQEASLSGARGKDGQPVKFTAS
jgi:arginine-tRNA-protein transferase